MSALYLSYDGLMEQLGQSQVLPYLRQLARGRPITLITYEKRRDLDDGARRQRFAEMATQAGIRWIPLRYHKTPSALATAYDLAVGFCVCALQCLRGGVRIVHARGYVMSVIALALKKVFGTRFIFDMRGFWLEQRVEMGVWKRDSTMFRIGSWFQDRFLQEADVVFCLSAAAKVAMQEWPAVRGRNIHFEVVTTCADLELFRPSPNGAAIRANQPFTLGYVGNAGPAYIFEQVLDLFLAVREIRPDARFKIVNRSDHAFISELLRERGISGDVAELAGCEHAEVPERMAHMDAAVFFVRPDPSRISSVPTRMGELLACGVPCVGNAGVADVLETLECEHVGVVLRDFSADSMRAGARGILELAAQSGVRERCVEVAKQHFSLEAGVAVYERVYRELESNPR